VRGPLVTIATYSQVFEADLSRAALGAHGIECFVPDAFVASLNPAYVPALGGVRLQVGAHDAERALEVLSLHELPSDDEDDEEDGPRCPRCGSEYAYLEWSAAVIWLSILLLYLPLLFLSKRWSCRKCNHLWREVQPPPERGSPYRKPRPSAVARAR
jgi:Putative prokaryotic signal transducing protein